MPATAWKCQQRRIRPKGYTYKATWESRNIIRWQLGFSTEVPWTKEQQWLYILKKQTSCSVWPLSKQTAINSLEKPDIELRKLTKRKLKDAKLGRVSLTSIFTHLLTFLILESALREQGRTGIYKHTQYIYLKKKSKFLETKVTLVFYNKSSLQYHCIT